MFLALILAGCDVGSLISVADTGGMGFFECDGTSESGVSGDFTASLAPLGCRYRVAAVDRDGYTLLLLDVPAFAEALGGASVTTTYTLPDETVRFEVQRGCGLDLGLCDDAGAEPIVMRTYTQTSGTVDVTAVPDGTDVRASVTFTDVVLTDEYGDTASIAARTWSDVVLRAAE